MPICLHCRKEVAPEDVAIPSDGKGHALDVNRCPECKAPGLYRGRTGLGSVVYGIGSWANSWMDSIDYALFTPAELRLIANDLEEQERNGGLRYPDGSGSGKAGRKEAK